MTEINHIKNQIRENEDPCLLIIQQEVEEFLRDLVLEYPFTEIFETLRRHEYRDRFGKNVTPMPNTRVCKDSLFEIQKRVDGFLGGLHSTFGKRYASTIDDSFKFYTITTREE